MKILFLDWNCFNKDDTINALKDMGHEVIQYIHEGYDDIKSDIFLKAFSEFVKNNRPDAAFSYNYYPVLAEACKQEGIPHIAFLYDNPFVYLYSYTLMYETNYVFIFDRSWVNEFRAGGLTNVHYMVLPGNPEKVSRLNKKYQDLSRTKSDVSFVGTLYNEQHNFYERLIENASDYLKGYLNGVMEAQLKLYGVSIVEAALTDDIIAMLKDALPAEEDPYGVEPKGYRYANYFIKRKITQLERMRLLTKLGDELGSKRDIKLFTVDPKVSFNGIKNMGPTPYETEMPFIFNDSKINLNISLRSINTGIPLRCMDILSSGGFLLSNYQSDLDIDFVAGEEYDYFEDADDMIAKIEYYLSHEKERANIAENGLEKVRNIYSFKSVFERIFEIVFGDNNV